MEKLTFIVHDKLNDKTMIVVFDMPYKHEMTKFENKKVEAYGEI